MARKIFILSLLTVGVLIPCSKPAPDPADSNNPSLAHSQSSTPSSTNPDSSTDAYIFPVNPESPAWASFQTHEEMVAACQIPPATLKNISTDGLIETSLNYPLLMDFIAYSNPQEGFERVVSRFNGLQELLQRPDAGLHLANRYRRMDPLAIEADWTLEQQGAYDWRLTSLEMFLAQDEILRGLTSAERRSLLAEAEEKVRAKQKRQDVYGYWGRNGPHC